MKLFRKNTYIGLYNLLFLKRGALHPWPPYTGHVIKKIKLLSTKFEIAYCHSVVLLRHRQYLTPYHKSFLEPTSKPWFSAYFIKLITKFDHCFLNILIINVNITINILILI